ncbi:oxidoreductase htatip2-like protein [Plasmopara halstedii]|uniref:Oxidoreductase htatip2-like protein n=1 Tax=Plasmopara halstedii TaxID=4781 RepID=A0A0P1B3I1_PLAHL|nr:oxidoreductase htatip2-like protein [Plasmopara halstedii]CEG49304.1 oxidoreductase htatip2-like protein [Plasmopara halstedii]|eukprot:XP_024585673.1 oxidoreductase htatip2-like protein [Plasmopara halstedii]
MASYVALVIGSTGAVGRDLVADLVASAKCAKVIALARHDVPFLEWKSTFPSLDAEAAKSKLEVRKVDFDNLSESDIGIADKIGAAFSCLGTTRKNAGSAEAFRKVDLDYVVKFAELCKAANVPYFGLVTSQGANKDSWFLYPQTKGEVEDKVLQMKFQRTSIFRPGMLQRGDLIRGTEKWFGWLVPGAHQIKVKAVAKGMVFDYESDLEGIKEWSHADLKKFE